MTDKVWYFSGKEGRHGPFTFEAMREIARTGGFGKEDLVWGPAFGSDWMQAGQVSGLFPEEKSPEEPPAQESRNGEMEVPPVPNPFQKPDLPLRGVRGNAPSAFRAAARAFRHMRDILFTSFDFSRWMSLGFCAWLCTIGTGVGGGSRSGISPDKVKSFSPGEVMTKIKAVCDSTLDQFSQALGSPRILLECGLFVVIFVLIGLWMSWLRCRGEFMFLHRWYRPKERIADSWRLSASAARELFRWKVCVYFLTFFVWTLVWIFGYLDIVQPYLANNRTWSLVLLLPVIQFVSLSLFLFLVSSTALAIASEFVVPVMYWQGVSASRAWLSALSLCWCYPFRICGYFFLRGILQALWFLVYALLVVGTLFIGLIPLAIPYVGAVALLPVTVFFRGYSIYYLNQWRPELVADA